MSQGEREDRDEGTGGERGKEAESVMEERGRGQEEEDDDSKRRYWNSIIMFFHNVTNQEWLKRE